MADGWEPIQTLPDLDPGELQIWRIDLAPATELPDIYTRHLPADELERAERVRAGQVRQQFLVARTCLRMLLGNILGVNPKDVPITSNTYGKPGTAPANGHPLHFNLAHSRETILIALNREGPVGIDLEYLDRETEVLEVSRNFFHPDEFHEIAAIVDPELRRRGFFQCWTRKEAVIKADGRGLSLPLTAFKVPVLGPAKVTQVTIANETDGLDAREPGTPTSPDYFVSDLSLGDHIVSAVASPTSHLRRRQLLFPLPALDGRDPDA